MDVTIIASALRVMKLTQPIEVKCRPRQRGNDFVEYMPERFDDPTFGASLIERALEPSKAPIERQLRDAAFCSSIDVRVSGEIYGYGASS